MVTACRCCDHANVKLQGPQAVCCFTGGPHAGIGLALEAAKTLQPGETLLVSRPLAVVTRSAEAAAELAAEAESSSSSNGNWVIPLDEEIEAVADQLAEGSSSSRTQVGTHQEAAVMTLLYVVRQGSPLVPRLQQLMIAVCMTMPAYTCMPICH